MSNEDWDNFLSEAGQHMAVISPDTCDVTHILAPVFSCAKMLHLSEDLMFPYYLFQSWGGDRSIAERNNNLPEHQWNNKTDKLYWRGSTTGGRNRIDNYEKAHRIRLIQTVHKDPTSFLYTHSNVYFSGVIQCNHDACEKMKKRITLCW